MLRKIRLTVAGISMLMILILFLDFTGFGHRWLGFMAKIQFIPAVLAVNAGVIIGLVALTLLFGRVYCSVICPLGIMQDLIAHFGKKRKKLPYSYSKAKNIVRIIFLIVFLATALAGLMPIAALLDPYGLFGRICGSFLQPLYQWANNLLAYFAERADSYAFYSVDVWLKSAPVMIVAGVSLIIVFIMAWRGGRTYCNTVCPVGTVLGFLSRFSLYKPVIDLDKCVNCGLCARKCKASCIDAKNHKIDYSRCVACMDCLENCSKKAISYKCTLKSKKDKQQPQADNSRRTFITAAVAVTAAGVMKAEEKTVDGGLAIIEDKKIPDRKTRITPPGSVSHRHMYQHCTACQLCISACPNGVLRPSNDLEHLMQPEMSFERGYCRPECHRCSTVCPDGAIKPITVEEKTAIQIGHAVWIKENCVALTDNVSCGNCERHCPTGAITMILSDKNNPDSPKIPMIDTERCIGCGACENLCPARPFSAIYIEGHEIHRTNI